MRVYQLFTHGGLLMEAEEYVWNAKKVMTLVFDYEAEAMTAKAGTN